MNIARIKNSPITLYSRFVSDFNNEQHRNAKRFAYLLAMEIKLYNSEILERGKAHRNVYGHLKEEIERSRSLYVERVPSIIDGDTRYFDSELVQVLAEGDRALMGHSA